MEQTHVPAFYTAQQVAEMTQMSIDWLRRMARENKIPHHRAGRLYRWTFDDLIALERQTAVPVSSPSDDDLVPSRLG